MRGIEYPSATMLRPIDRSPKEADATQQGSSYNPKWQQFHSNHLYGTIDKAPR